MNDDPPSRDLTAAERAMRRDYAARPENSALLTDLYQLNMIRGYLETGMTGTAAFEFFVRRLPKPRGFLMAAGLAQVVEYLEGLRFTPDELQWLAESGRFDARMIDYLAALRFPGDVDAMPEGTVFFGDEPIIRITAPLPLAQLVETRIINLLHYESLIASKAARMVLAAPGKTLVDFGLRRAHGAEAGLMAARASYLAGFAGSATLLAEAVYGVPAYGTMAHSFIQAHDDESAAFEAFARSRPANVVLLIDTYDTERAAEKVVALAPRLKREGITVRGVRLDSGDLADHARKVRAILDAGGLKDAIVFASGGLDEDSLLRFARERAPIDGYGIGTSLTTSSDVPALDCAYKLQEYAGQPRRKRSTGKATWPGRKQVYRQFDAAGRIALDTVTIEGDEQPGTPLLVQVMRNGRRVNAAEPIASSRARAAAGLQSLPDALRALARPQTDALFQPVIAQALRDLATEADRIAEAAHDLDQGHGGAARLE
jgi:nicotinate phosphoribosyltransferase